MPFWIRIIPPLMDYQFRDSKGNGSAPLDDIRQSVNEGGLSPETLVSYDGARWVNVYVALHERDALPPSVVHSEPQRIYVESPKKSGGCGTFLAALAIVFVLVIIVSALVGGPSSGSSRASDSDTSMTAYYTAQTFVKKNLKNPSAAEFENAHEEGNQAFHHRRKDGLYEVGGVVRSTNSFGGVVPTDWRCVLEPDSTGGTWSLRYLKVGDHEDRPYPPERD